MDSALDAFRSLFPSARDISPIEGVHEQVFAGSVRLGCFMKSNRIFLLIPCDTYLLPDLVRFRDEDGHSYSPASSGHRNGFYIAERVVLHQL